MRTRIVLLALAAVACGSAASADELKKSECRTYESGARLCKDSTGAVETYTPDGFGGYRTITTDPTKWKTPNSYGGLWEAPKGVVTATTPERMNAKSAGAPAWPAREAAVSEPAGRRIHHPDGSTTTCYPDGGVTRCKR